MPQKKSGFGVEFSENQSIPDPVTVNLGTLLFSGGLDGKFRGAAKFVFPPGVFKQVKYEGNFTDMGKKLVLNFTNPNNTNAQITFNVSNWMEAFDIKASDLPQEGSDEEQNDSGARPSSLNGQVERIAAASSASAICRPM